MAKMYPPQRPVNSNSGAEQRLYKIFEHQLEKDFHIYHSRWWQFPNKIYGLRETETDFLIAHPIFGIMVIEVKGGKIKYDRFNDTWLTYENKIKDPYKQARTNIFSLKDFLDSRHTFFNSRHYTHKWCVIFPDVDEVNNLPTFAEGKTLTAKNIENISDEITRIFQSGPQGRDLLGEEGLTKLFNVVAPDTRFEYFDINEIERNKICINQLTEDQQKILLELYEFRQVVVMGCAGSGKTQLAIAKVKQLSRQGIKTLFLCKSKNLSGYLYLQLKDLLAEPEKKLKILCFDKLLRVLGIDSRQIGSIEEAFERVLKSKKYSYEAVIIDEGQDFHPDQVKAIKQLLSDRENSYFYIFQDDNQNIYKTRLHKLVKIYPRKLIQNVRNTDKIFDGFKVYIANNEYLLNSGHIGPEVEIVHYSSQEQLLNLLLEKLNHVTKVRGIRPNFITILTNKIHGSILDKVSNLESLKSN